MGNAVAQLAQPARVRLHERLNALALAEPRGGAGGVDCCPRLRRRQPQALSAKIDKMLLVVLAPTADGAPRAEDTPRGWRRRRLERRRHRSWLDRWAGSGAGGANGPPKTEGAFGAATRLVSSAAMRASSSCSSSSRRPPPPHLPPSPAEAGRLGTCLGLSRTCLGHDAPERGRGGPPAGGTPLAAGRLLVRLLRELEHLAVRPVHSCRCEQRLFTRELEHLAVRPVQLRERRLPLAHLLGTDPRLTSAGPRPPLPGGESRIAHPRRLLPHVRSLLVELLGLPLQRGAHLHRAGRGRAGVGYGVGYGGAREGLRGSSASCRASRRCLAKSLAARLWQAWGSTRGEGAEVEGSRKWLPAASAAAARRAVRPAAARRSCACPPATRAVPLPRASAAP